MKQKYIVSMGIALAMIAWLYSGQMGSTAEQGAPGAAVAEAESENVVTVRGALSQAIPHTVHLRVRGRTEVNRQVKVRAEVVGRVVELPVTKGDVVREGDVLCKLAVDNRARNLAEARASQHQARLEYKGLLDLADKGLQSEIAIAQARARLESANAAVNRAVLALGNITIKAPFDGLVEEQPVELGDYLGVGGECATIVDVDPALVAGQVAEREVGHLELGQVVNGSLITGETFTGEVTFIGHTAENATRSYRLEIEVPNPEGRFRAGITSEVVIPVDTRLAHLLAPSSLVLDDEGRLGVRTVDDNDLVAFYQVVVISEENAGVWVTGLPDKVRLITVGQEIVFTGQEVSVDLTPLTSLVSE